MMMVMDGRRSTTRDTSHTTHARTDARAHCTDRSMKNETKRNSGGEEAREQVGVTTATSENTKNPKSKKQGKQAKPKIGNMVK